MKKIIAALMAAVLVLTGMAAAFAEGTEIWRKGDSGEKVTWIQTRLIELEYLEGDPSGVFDDATEEALQRFQRDVGIAAQTILLAAAEMGLGGCMIGNYNRADLIKALKLDKHLEPMLVVAVGKPVARYERTFKNLCGI